MLNERDKTRIITYPPEHLRTFELFIFEWIDNLNFTLDPAECVSNAEEYIAIVKEMLVDSPWQGDGKIELMWIPPFMFEQFMADDTMGMTVWHVKQKDDGLSFILHPPGLFAAGKAPLPNPE